MVQFGSFLEGIARSMSRKKNGSAGSCKNGVSREVVEELGEEERMKHQLFRSNTLVNTSSDYVASVFSMKGKKDVNQDFSTVWKNFGNQDDMILCGAFDGHGPWGHLVSRRVGKQLPPLLLCCWQHMLAQKIHDDFDRVERPFDIWTQSYLMACDAIDKELERNTRVDSYRSGTTGLVILKEGDRVMIANVGDSRAVLGKINEDGNLVAIQLTVDQKPNLPQEAERIVESNGRVFCNRDEPGVYRLCKPGKEGCGLALSRAFGDLCMKEFGLISTPQVTNRHISDKDQFIILATDGVWDVLSNEEAVEIVRSAPDRVKSAKRLVKCAAHAWKCKKPGLPMDDISAVCLHLNESFDV